MKKTLETCLDIKKMCNLKGRLHIYFIDINGVIQACNKLTEDFFRDLLGCEKILGVKCLDLFKNSTLNPLHACTKENEEIMKSGLPRQFFQSWSIKCLYRLDLLTFKQPIYDNSGKPKGILVTSHFLNMFSVENAYALGLTERQTECLFYLFEGHTAKEIAKIIKLSYRTVEGYIDRMRNKLNCANTSELLLKALQSQVRIGINHLMISQTPNPFCQKDTVRVEFL